MLKDILKIFNINEKKINQLNDLRKICLEYNKHTNLTSITNEQEFNIKHIFDSLSIIDFFELDNKKILDVGSGGGFPGLVLAIVFDKSEITMIDSNNKKIKYINFAIKKLGLKNALTIVGRVEEQKITEQFDVVVSRAVASLNILLEITAKPIKKNGYLILYKGENLEKELPPNWLIIEEKLGLKFNNIDLFNIDEKTVRRIISFRKEKSTLNKYPRPYFQIRNLPLY